MLVANEVVYKARRKKKKGLLLKVDFEKAYDFVNWEFLWYMLQRLGFDGKWIRWMMAYLKSSSMSMLVNRSPTNEFIMEIGLQQGNH